MNENILLLGSESSALYYNLNRQFSTLKRLIITSDYIFEHFKSGEFKDSIKILSQSSQEEYLKNLHEGQLKQSLEEGEFDTAFYNKLQETLTKMYENFTEVKLKDYNFMNSISNTRYTLILRCGQFSKTKYYLEKGVLLSNIKQLIIHYLCFEGNSVRLKELPHFQIECYQSEEVSKTVILKKDGNKLILSSSFAFPRKEPFDHLIGPELYFSEGERFHFFKNSQESALVREHNKMEELEIHSQEKVLSNENLIAVNETSKRINDATIELFITKKGAIHIAHVSLLEATIERGNEQGVLFHKSKKHYTKVSLLTLRDNIEEEKPNPKYLLLRNNDEIKEALESPRLFREVDGVILCKPFYSSYFDKVAQAYDLDFLFLNKSLSKNLEQEITVEELKVEQEEKNRENPFSGIIKEQEKEKDDFLERLKNMDLNTSKREEQRNGQEEINALAQSLISSPQSSMKRQNSHSGIGGETMYSPNGAKKSAIQMLASSVLANDQKPLVQEEKQELSPPPVQQREIRTENISSSFVEQNVKATELSPVSSDMLSSFTQSFEESNHQPSTPKENLDFSRYDSVLVTTLISGPELPGDAVFLDSSQEEQAHGRKAYVLVNSEEEMTQKEHEYLIAASVCKGRSKRGAVLINGPKDFFSIFSKQTKVMLNLVPLEPFMKKKMLEKSIEEFGVLLGVILYKEDLELVAEHINKIEAIYIKDIENQDELEQLKKELLRYEKNYLMKLKLN